MSIPNPVVLLDARGRYLHPGFSSDRSSAIAAYGPDGTRREIPARAVPWDFDPETGEALGLRVESEAENLFPNSDILTWQPSRVAVTASAVEGLDDTRIWRRVEALTAGSEERYVRSSFVAQADEYYTASVDVAAGEVGFVVLFLSSQFNGEGVNAGARACFDLATGEAISAPSEATMPFATCRRLRNGAMRVSLTAYCFVSGSAELRLVLQSALSVSSGSNLSASDGLYLDAPQIEKCRRPGLPNLATSYIATAGASALRSADRVYASFSNQGAWFNRLEGTLVADAIPYSGDVSPVVGIRASSSLAGLGFRCETHEGAWRAIARGQEGAINIQVQGGGTGALSRAAMAYNFNKSALHFAVNGSDFASGSIPDDLSPDDLSDLNIGRYPLTGSFPANVCMNGWIKRLYYYPVAATPAELQALSALQE